MSIQESLLYHLASRRRAPAGEEALSSHGTADYDRDVRTPALEAYRDGPALFRAFGDLGLRPGDLAGRRILDIGSGLGGRTVYYASLGAEEVVGLEPNPHFLREAEKLREHLGQERVRFLEGCGEELPFPPARFDLVVSMDSMEHVADPLAVLREIHRVLDPSGAAYLSFPPILHPEGDHLRDVFRLNRVHWFFSRRAMIRVYQRLAAELPLGEAMIRQKIRLRDGREEFHHINWMTCSQFFRHVRRSGLVIAGLDIQPLLSISRRSEAPAGSRRWWRELLRPLVYHLTRLPTRLPGLREILTHRIRVKLVRRS